MKKLKYILEDLRWLKVLNSPFKPFSVSWYIGKTQVGTPYFLPRKWVKATPALATEAALNEIRSAKEWNERNRDSTFKHRVKSFEEAYKEKMTYRFPVPLKVGFSYCGLGWKTKWTDTDFRYEWGPVLSFVFFGYQIAAMVGYKHASHYWECWLYYEYATDKTKSKHERIEQCRKEFPQTWTVSSMGKEEVVDYYQRILKTKYL
jgi:hypothetical protein